MSGKSLHQRLRQARLARGLTLRDIEKASEGQITNSYVNRLERGLEDIKPHPDKLRVLSRILQIDYLELMILAGCLTIKDLKGRVA
jgi:transcriptional regulator with XRE-family HTH domain